MKINKNNKNFFIPEFHHERLKKFDKIKLNEFNVNAKKPELKIETFIIPIVTCGLYFLFYDKILPFITGNGFGKFMVYFLLISSAINMAVTLIKLTLDWYRYGRIYSKAKKEYNEYLDFISKKINDNSAEYVNIMNEVFPSMEQIYEEVQADSTKNLWSHTPDYKSFLNIKIGYIVDSDNPCCIDTVKSDDKKEELPEKLNDRINDIIKNTKTITKKIPYVIPLKNTVIGIVRSSSEIKQAIINQITYFTSPADVIIIPINFDKRKFVIPKKYIHEQYNKDTPVVYIIDNYSAYCMENPLFYEKLQNLKGKVSMIIFDNEKNKLPVFCNRVFDADVSENPIYLQEENSETKIIPDFSEMEELLRISAFVEKFDIPHSENSVISVPDRISFFNFHNIAEYHIENDFQNRKLISDFIHLQAENIYPEELIIPVGIGENSQNAEINITNVKHGVLAGYTGSGKSQFLLSMMLSLSIKYHPDFVKFTFIDFKGGSSSEQLKRLPHFAGSFTDVDGAEKVIRVIAILEQEGKRRQKILQNAFDEGLIEQMEILEYHKALKKNMEENDGKTELKKMPYLMIVIDEFTELLSQYNNFLKDLESIARLGRSRGMFLLLCAQKPFSSLNGQIQSNIGYTICLKTNSKEDSKAAIGTDSAYLLTNKGSGYLKTVDDKNIVYFQSPYSMEKTDDNRTQINFTVSELHDYYCTKNFQQEMVFSNELPLVLNGIEKYALNGEQSFNLKTGGWGNPNFSSHITVSVGLIDNVREQKSQAAELDLCSGNTIIYGNVLTGKTTLIYTIITNIIKKYSPKMVNIFVMNFGELGYTEFSEMPHISAIINPNYTDDSYLFYRSISMIGSEIQSRKRILGSMDIEEYNKENQGREIPYIFCFIDGFDFISDEYPREYETLQGYIKKSNKCGIKFIVSSRTLVIAALRSQFKNVFTFKFRDDCYSETMNVDVIKKVPDIKGRCLTNINKIRIGMEMQVCLPIGIDLSAENDVNIYKELKHQLDGIKYIYYKNNSYRARRIPVMAVEREKEPAYNPKYTPLVPVEKFIKSDAFKNDKLSAAFGLKVTNVKTFTKSIENWHALTIAGIKSCGKTTAVKAIISPLMEKNKDINWIIFDNEDDDFSNYSNNDNVEYYENSVDALKEFFRMDKDGIKHKYESILEEKAKKGVLIIVCDDFPRFANLCTTNGLDFKPFNDFIIKMYIRFKTFKFIISGNIFEFQKVMLSEHEKSSQNLWVVGGIPSQLGYLDPDNRFSRDIHQLPQGHSLYINMGEVNNIKF